MVRGKSKWQKHQCDRCGFAYKKKDLKRQRGLLVCVECYDGFDPSVMYPKWGSARSDSSSTDAVYTPSIVALSTSGIASLTNVFTFDDDGEHYHFTMYVQGSGGAVTITSIAEASAQGTTLTLKGQSDTNAVTLDASSSDLELIDGDIVLGNNDSAVLVYQDTVGSSGGWQEVSRNVNGIV